MERQTTMSNTTRMRAFLAVATAAWLRRILRRA
ncbi:hypothetical protein OR221_2495 [Microbacterium laevaniformans OR221]|jgi:hypothetical protein|nr:hypothetical protein OR221_2495 [Microbacterium laevaniformans OR221]